MRQDFEGDHFTFFKFPLEDLEALFGLAVQELAIYDSVESHTLSQLERGRLVLIEVDSHWLPDARPVLSQGAREDDGGGGRSSIAPAGASATSTTPATTSSLATITTGCSASRPATGSFPTSSS